MPLKEFLKYLSVGIALIAVAICVVSLIHAITSSGGFETIVHELEGWVSEVAYATALIILAAAGVMYLTRKA